MLASAKSIYTLRDKSREKQNVFFRNKGNLLSTLHFLLREFTPDLNQCLSGCVI